MKLQEKIKNDLKSGIKNRETNKVKYLRVIIGEFQRLEYKEVSDDAILLLLNSVAQKAKKNIEKYNFDVKDNKEFISLIEGYTGIKYLINKASEEEIKTWIEENIDFGDFKNKMAATGIVMKHFKSSADNKTVKSILEKM